MKKFLAEYCLIIFLLISISILAIQKEANENRIVPDQTVVISAILRSGVGIPVIIVKGLLNPENEGKKWLTLKDFMEKQLKHKPYNKNTFEVSK